MRVAIVSRNYFSKIAYHYSRLRAFGIDDIKGNEYNNIGHNNPVKYQRDIETET
jgi:hypothetical protein